MRPREGAGRYSVDFGDINPFVALLSGTN